MIIFFFSNMMSLVIYLVAQQMTSIRYCSSNVLVWGALLDTPSHITRYCNFTHTDIIGCVWFYNDNFNEHLRSQPLISLYLTQTITIRIIHTSPCCSLYLLVHAHWVIILVLYTTMQCPQHSVCPWLTNVTDTATDIILKIQL